MTFDQRDTFSDDPVYFSSIGWWPSRTSSSLSSKATTLQRWTPIVRSFRKRVFFNPSASRTKFKKSVRKKVDPQISAIFQAPIVSYPHDTLSIKFEVSSTLIMRVASSLEAIKNEEATLFEVRQERLSSIWMSACCIIIYCMKESESEKISRRKFKVESRRDQRGIILATIKSQMDRSQWGPLWKLANHIRKKERSTSRSWVETVHSSGDHRFFLHSNRNLTMASKPPSYRSRIPKPTPKLWQTFKFRSRILYFHSIVHDWVSALIF